MLDFRTRLTTPGISSLESLEYGYAAPFTVAVGLVKPQFPAISHGVHRQCEGLYEQFGVFCYGKFKY